LRDSFTMVFAQNSSIFHWAVHQPIAFSRFEVTRLWLPLRCHVFFTCTHAHKPLRTKCNYYARLL